MMLSVAATCVAASAQETTGTITGTTTDQTGSVLPGVTVTIKNTDTGTTRAVVTNTTGTYTASRLPIAAYEVTFEPQGFQTVTLKNIALHVNGRLQLDGRMPADTFGQILNSRAPREIQLGLKFYW
jgi:hypothetical protein